MRVGKDRIQRFMKLHGIKARAKAKVNFALMRIYYTGKNISLDD